QNSHLVFGTTPQFIGVQDLGTGYLYNARSTLTTVTDYGENRRRDTINEQFSTSYVTGSHAFKTGVQLMQGLDNENSYIPNDLTYPWGAQLSACGQRAPFQGSLAAARRRLRPVRQRQDRGQNVAQPVRGGVGGGDAAIGCARAGDRAQHDAHLERR